MAVEYFRSCVPSPKLGALIIGQPDGSSCLRQATTNLVILSPLRSHPAGLRSKSLSIHGLRVRAFTSSGSTTWYVPSKNVVISAVDPQSSKVLATLRVVTRKVASNASGRHPKGHPNGRSLAGQRLSRRCTSQSVSDYGSAIHCQVGYSWGEIVLGCQCLRRTLFSLDPSWSLPGVRQRR